MSLPAHGEAQQTVWVRPSRVVAVRETTYEQTGPMTTIFMRGGMSFTSTASGVDVLRALDPDLP